jgi:hypothetical protein
LPPALTPEQHKRFASEPKVPWRAIDAVVEAIGDDAVSLSRDAMLVVAMRAAMEAAATYDAARGVEYAQWALYYAVYALLERLRKDVGKDKPTLARIRRAMCGFLAHEKQAIDPWKVTRVSSAQGLSGLADAVVVSGALAWGGVTTLLARGEDGVQELEEAANAGEALRKVVGDLRPEQRRLIERCYEYDTPVKEVAAEAGGKGYRAVLREYHDLLTLMGARMAGFGFKTRPAWVPEVSGQVFEGRAANDDDG